MAISVSIFHWYGWQWKKKLHRNGNNYHTLTDALKSVIYNIEIVEVRDKPKLCPNSPASFEYELKHKVTPLLLRSNGLFGLQSCCGNGQWFGEFYVCGITMEKECIWFFIIQE